MTIYRNSATSCPRSPQEGVAVAGKHSFHVHKRAKRAPPPPARTARVTPECILDVRRRETAVSLHRSLASGTDANGSAKTARLPKCAKRIAFHKGWSWREPEPTAPCGRFREAEVLDPKGGAQAGHWPARSRLLGQERFCIPPPPARTARAGQFASRERWDVRYRRTIF